jgi:hypothetical protein
VQKRFINNEEEVLNRLKSTYQKSYDDVTEKIKKLQFDIDGMIEEYEWEEDVERMNVLESRIQSKIYQQQYQQALQKQLDGILNDLHKEAYTTVDAYLKKSYEDGYIGTMYDLQGQGIPLIMPIDQEAITRAVQIDPKISRSLYSKMGENVAALKRNIAAEVSRGIATSASFAAVARQISFKMKGTYNTNGGAMGRALTIARTEGHRVQIQGAMDACYKAKDMGCDVVKQWDSTLDNRTRPSHRVADGEIRELDEPFSNKLLFPGDSKGKAAEVVNCRCALLQRAKWALDEDELETLKKRAEFYGLDKTENFEDFKEKYLKSAEFVNNSVANDNQQSATISVTRENLKKANVDYKDVKRFNTIPTENEIISRLAGGDETKGSCSSLAFAFIGNKCGFDVLDFRDGESREFFSRDPNIIQIMKDVPGVNGIVHKVKKEAAEAAKIAMNLEKDKLYYFATGKHAAIVRNTGEDVEWMELQSKYKNGWRSCKGEFGTVTAAFQKRFACRKTVDKSFGRVWEKDVIVMDVDSFSDNEEFRQILGYINTAEDKQRKGAKGDVK